MVPEEENDEEKNGKDRDSNPEPAKGDDNSADQSTAKKKSGFVLSDLSFEELKLEVRMMPAVVTRKGGAGSGGGERGRSCSEGGVGSLTEHRLDDDAAAATGGEKTAKKLNLRQQFSLNDELLSRERLQVQIKH